MDWELILLTILGSSVVATIVTKFFDRYAEQKRVEESRYKEFYAPIRFYLMMIDSLEKNRDDLMKEKKNERSTDPIYDQEIDSLNEKIWVQLDSMDAIIKDKSEYIKLEDFKLITDFVDARIKRDIAGRFSFKSNLASGERLGAILKVIKTLKEKFLK